MTRSRIGASALGVLAAGTLLSATGASASSPPGASLLFDPVHGSLGGLRLGDPMSKLYAVFGKPDRVFRGEGGPVSMWLRRRGVDCSAWAIAYQRSRRSNALVDLTYRGPLRTERGDRLGTPLRVVRSHWRSGWTYVPKGVTRAQGPNYGRITPWGSAAFGFDARNRLGGVSMRISEQIWQPIVLPC